MRTTTVLLVAGLASTLVGGVLGWSAGDETGLAFVVLGLLLLVGAIANSYLNDVREGYRSTSEE